MLKVRFSLLLLEPGEIYFEDYGCVCYRGADGENDAHARSSKGRLKVCSKSILFDPKDVLQPILKFPLRDCQTIERWQGSLMSKIDKGNVIYIECDQVIEMLEGNIIAPYTFRREKSRFRFALQYVTASACVARISQLKRASMLPSADQAVMISAIVNCRQGSVKFDTSWLEDLHETILLETTSNKITPLVVNPGRLLLTTSRLYFQPYNNAEPWPVLKIKLSNIKRVIKRRFLLKQVGLELYCSKQSAVQHLFLSFKNQTERDVLFSKLIVQPELKLEDTGQENMTLLWQNGLISNYDYLLYLNSLADRSFNDLTQYPVFPWILSDYTSTSIDLSDPSIYRDLTKPVGALSEERLTRLKERYEEMADPKFLYGSHYSTPGFVLYYLVRKMPQYMLCLQNGRFDHPDRMFNSVPDTWRNITTNTSDFKELIPQFYEPDAEGRFLLNAKNLNFGLRMDGSKVGDVELPAWAKDPGQFVQVLREALESSYSSAHLHHWIDLVFGYKQRGEEAIKADNVFYHLTYEGAVDLDGIRDANERYALEVQIMEFGQIPKQLFQKPHPCRRVPLSPIGDHLPEFPSLYKDSKSRNDSESSTRSESASKRWQKDMTQLTICLDCKGHKEQITDVCITKDQKYIFSVSQDGLLKMYSLEEKRQLRSINVYNMALSSCSLMEDDRTVVVGSWDNYVYLYNVEYGKLLATTMAHDDSVTDVFFSNNLLVTASMDSTAKVWSYELGESARPNFSLSAELDHEASVLCLSVNEGRTLLVTGTCTGYLYIWDLVSFCLVGQHLYHSGVIHAVPFSPDGQKVATCGSDGTLKVIDVQTATLLFSAEAGEQLRCLCWDGSTAVLGSVSGNLLVWDLFKAELLETLSAHRGGVTCVTASRDGGVLVTAGEDLRVLAWRSGDTPR
ncbi:LOW QUALITY PROTEIN: protein FAN-like [Uloborus diversus]|uniref:LOW QUALITY PROTEIN: protein FAN-like n=1 Tax=Uloborus diversus TaxID=327109 RepID=UPI002409E89B|nr:LOW QUALITY PROTEIN: protein FAN-like [Uloborus diversus]